MKKFDEASIDAEGNVVLWKSMGEGSGFTIIANEGYTELWDTTQYGCNTYLYKNWSFCNIEEAYNLGMTFT